MLARKVRELEYEFKAKQSGVCAICKSSINQGDLIGKLVRPIRSDARNMYDGLPAYIDRTYAHVECANPEPLSCEIHGQSAYVEEEECPICGRELR